MENTQYILIEGTDMAGKTTTVSNFIASRSDTWNVRHNSLLDTPNPLGELVDKIVEQREYNKTTINLAYAASALMDIDMFEWPTVNTIQESASIVRSIGHAHANNDKGLEDVLMNIISRLPSFNHSFYLTASRECRLSRLAMRGTQSSNDKLIVNDPSRFFLIDDIAMGIAIDRFGATVIDTSASSQDEVREIINQEVGPELGEAAGNL